MSSGCDSASALLLHAAELRQQTRIAECLECLRRALALNPQSARARYDLACVQLLTGNYPEGFAAYESRWEAAGLPRPVNTDRAALGEEWRGAGPAGKRVLLHAEQGFGDTIQFIRYAPMVAELGAEVVVEVQPALRDLAACMTLGGAVGNGFRNGSYDFHCSLMDLPAAFGTTLHTAPPPVRLNVPEEAKRSWLTRIPETGRMKLGIVWAGNRQNSIDWKRSLSLDLLKPALDASSDADFFSFQVGPPADQLKPFERRVTGLQPYLGNFVDSAAALLRMDRVITVDTAVAHLAGSLGLEVWLLLSYSPCWRWLLNCSASPWYPTMRLFRQPSPGDWKSVVREVVACGVTRRTRSESS